MKAICSNFIIAYSHLCVLQIFAVLAATLLRSDSKCPVVSVNLVVQITILYIIIINHVHMCICT